MTFYITKRSCYWATDNLILESNQRKELEDLNVDSFQCH